MLRLKRQPVTYVRQHNEHMHKPAYTVTNMRQFCYKWYSFRISRLTPWPLGPQRIKSYERREPRHRKNVAARPRGAQVRDIALVEHDGQDCSIGETVSRQPSGHIYETVCIRASLECECETFAHCHHDGTSSPCYSQSSTKPSQGKSPTNDCSREQDISRAISHHKNSCKKKAPPAPARESRYWQGYIGVCRTRGYTTISLVP
jgi:hypothetical protein